MSTFRFTADGRVLLFEGGVGGGTWTPAGPESFVYRVAEPVFDANGAYTGWVDIEQSAVLDENSFASTGTTIVYDADDRRKYSARVDIRARRRP
ncbi:hypothetical protein ACWD4B_13130 [Streptomyces sp. NPDC002536]